MQNLPQSVSVRIERDVHADLLMEAARIARAGKKKPSLSEIIRMALGAYRSQKAVA